MNLKGSFQRIRNAGEQWLVRRNGRRSRRKWQARPSVAAEILESRSMLSASLTSFFLVNDTGIEGDNVTADGTISGSGTASGMAYVYIQLDFDQDGVVDKTISADLKSDGTFTFTYDATTDLPSGPVTIQARTAASSPYGSVEYGDWVPLTFTFNKPPLIGDFQAIEGPGNVWTFSGHVEDENTLSLTITFGGLLEGHQVIVEMDGSFTYAVELADYEEGLVTAQTTDEYGEDSNVAEDWVT